MFPELSLSPMTTPALAFSESAEPVVAWAMRNSEAMISAVVNVAVILVLAVVARFVLGRLVTHLTNRVVEAPTPGSGRGAADGSAARKQARVQTIGSVLRNLASIVVYGVALLMVLGEIGISLGPILASAGVVGLAIGFGAQGLVRDFVSGLFLMMEDQYGVGDVVDVGDAVGTVEDVGLRITKIRDLDGGLWYIRNGEILRVCNMNQDWANAVVELPLSYATDLEQATQAIERGLAEISSEHADQLVEPPELAGLVGVSGGALSMRIIAKTRPGEQWALSRAMRARIKRSLDEAGIDLARPVVTTV
ncbi:mechanosensitive ion channel family protein [Lipingzhangella sp. LS1_29]|uniref:Mechanosensitive ion channel family protein n=1 Tax=Lipingzhangella rawalii TaxID=2055835 RepID=A0ABU2HBD3_9ACTN|nr:mechanosensitive ion channel family protein [Lipingzhangella rawalii]MDS1272622.1 mechanosensitive ion channel family protein [Lipingzhangella rawalii]